jgi:rhodanese-related sulfurtransferase
MSHHFRRVVAVVLLALFTSSCATAADKSPADKATHKDVDAAEFERLAKQPDTVILDVRTPGEYAAGHVKDAKLINWNDKTFGEQIAKLDKGKTYLVYCAVGGRSAKACSKLDGLGVAKVYNLAGGIKAWETAGKPVEK